jgi:hypothetical protein
MHTIWRKHLVICLFLGLLAIPIYFVDLASTRGGDGNWISLDFRGLIFWTYVTLIVIHFALSSIGILSFPKTGAVRIHFWAIVLSVILLIAGFVAYGKLLRAQAISNRSAIFEGEIAELMTSCPRRRDAAGRSWAKYCAQNLVLVF